MGRMTDLRVLDLVKASTVVDSTLTVSAAGLAIKQRELVRGHAIKLAICLRRERAVDPIP